MKTLFVLEDDYISSMMYQMRFEKQYEVKLARNANDFKEYFAENEPDFALIDVNIKDPLNTGIDLVDSLIKDNPEIKTKFVVLSAYGASSLNLSDHFYSYIQKPVDLDRLDVVIKEAIAN